MADLARTGRADTATTARGRGINRDHSAGRSNGGQRSAVASKPTTETLQVSDAVQPVFLCQVELGLGDGLGSTVLGRANKGADQLELLGGVGQWGGSYRKTATLCFRATGSVLDGTRIRIVYIHL